MTTSIPPNTLPATPVVPLAAFFTAWPVLEFNIF